MSSLIARHFPTPHARLNLAVHERWVSRWMLRNARQRRDRTDVTRQRWWLVYWQRQVRYWRGRCRHRKPA